MDLFLLRTFIVVAETGSFSDAGDRLHLTPSTISHQIARLESSIGKRLFDRTTRSCTLTSVGQQLLRSSRDVVVAFDDLAAKFRPNSIRGDVRLGVPADDHLFTPIMNAIVEFSNEQSGIDIFVTSGLSATLAHWIELGELDLAILREISPESDRSEGPMDLVWISGEKDRPTDRGIIKLALVQEPCVYRKAALSALRLAGYDHRVLISCSGLSGVLAAVRASFAVSVVTRQDAMALDGIHIVQDGLPSLPTTELKLHFHGERRTAVGRALASRLEYQLASSKLMPLAK